MSNELTLLEKSLDQQKGINQKYFRVLGNIAEEIRTSRRTSKETLERIAVYLNEVFDNVKLSRNLSLEDLCPKVNLDGNGNEIPEFLQ